MNLIKVCIFLSILVGSNSVVAGTAIGIIESEAADTFQALQITLSNNMNTCTHANAVWAETAYLSSTSSNFNSI